VSNRWRQSILAVPSIGVSVLPKLACPACWPAYTGLLTSIGLGFLISVRYLLPLTVAFLVLALAAMPFRARDRHGYGPFCWQDSRPAAFSLASSRGIPDPPYTARSGYW